MDLETLSLISFALFLLLTWTKVTGISRRWHVRSFRDTIELFRLGVGGRVEKEASPDRNPERRKGMREHLRQAGYTKVRPAEFIFSSILGGIGFGLIVKVLLDADVLAVSGGLVFMFLPYQWVKRRSRLIEEQLTYQLLSAVQQIAGLVNRGTSIQDAIESVSDTPAPLGPHLRRIIDDSRLGKPFQEAVLAARTEIGIEGFDMLAAAIAVSFQFGAQLGPSLEEVSIQLRRIIQTNAMIKARFSQSHASYLLVAGMAIPIQLFWLLTRPELIQGVYQSPLGQLSILFACVWAYLGRQLMNQMSSLEAAL